MQGLPTQLTKIASAPAGKVENSPLNALSGESSVETAGTSDFSALFANILGGDSAKTTPVVEGKGSNKEKSQVDDNTTSVDVLLNVKGKEQSKKQENAPLKTDVALSAEVLKNIDNLLVKTPVEGLEEQAVVGEKVAKTSGNIEELLNTLKGTGDKAVEVEGEVDGEDESFHLPNTESNQRTLKGAKSQSPLDFLLKESKSPNVGMEVAPKDLGSKLGLSSEDFIKNATAAKTAPGEKNAVTKETFDPQQLVQKHMNQSMKSYGDKQGLLNNNLIKNTKDLAFKDQKPKSTIDELKTPDLKIGAELSSVKEDFIPLMQKQESNQNLQAQTQTKVLDLSRIDSTNTNEIIKRISDYVQQSQVANKDSLDLTVKHESLGQFNIQVSRSQGAGKQMMDMQITTNSAEGHEFFTKHEIGLMKNLSQAGVQLSDLRIVSSGSESMSFSQNDNRQSGNSQYNGDNATREFMSFDSGDSSNGSQRRKALWEQAQQNLQRYGA